MHLIELLNIFNLVGTHKVVINNIKILDILVLNMANEWKQKAAQIFIRVPWQFFNLRFA